MTAGLNHPGRIVLGDLDPWTFTANKDDAILLNIGEPIAGEVDPGFFPWIRLFGPDGKLLESQSGARAAQITETAPLTGTYTVVVTSAFANIAEGQYLLTLVKAPGTFEVPIGDAGGPITAGDNHPGVIAIGDLDPWTFTANRNDAIVLRIGEPLLTEVDPGFYPWIRVFGPDGAQLGSQSGSRSAQINLTAPLTGTYTVVVTSAFVNVDDGHYLLTLVKVPGPFVVPPGDDGGPITRTAADRGDIALGDLDPWTFTAGIGNAIALSIGETMIGEVDPGFYPWIRLFGPDGAQLGSQSGALTATINVSAPLTGTYTVVVTSSFVNTAVGHYMLTVSGATPDSGDRHAAPKPDDLQRAAGDAQRGGDGNAAVVLSVVSRPQRDHDLADYGRHGEHLHHPTADHDHQLLGAGVEFRRQRQLSDRHDHRGDRDAGVHRPAVEPLPRCRVERVVHRSGGLDAAADLSLAGVVERRIDLDQPVGRPGVQRDRHADPDHHGRDARAQRTAVSSGRDQRERFHEQRGRHPDHRSSHPWTCRSEQRRIRRRVSLQPDDRAHGASK